MRSILRTTARTPCKIIAHIRFRMAYLDPERTLAYQREYRAKNRDRILAQRREMRSTPEAKARQREQNQRNYYGHEGMAPGRVTNQDRHFRLKYGITLVQRDEMLAAQGGCAICRVTEAPTKKGWVVDHCHSSGKVRGILCNACNVAIGHARDDAALLRKMADYLDIYGDVAEKDHAPQEQAA